MYLRTSRIVELRIINHTYILRITQQKVIVEQLSEFCKAYSKLHLGQMGARKKRSVIDVVAILVHKVQENWSKK